MAAGEEHHVLDLWDASHSIHYDPEAKHYWCGLCTCAAMAETACQRVVVAAIGPFSSDVDDHLASAQHSSVFELQVLHLEEFLPIELNGMRMLLDHHCIFPQSMFGAGCSLYDETMGMLLGVDVCGAVRVFPNHRYRVVRLMVPEAPPEPTTKAQRLNGGGHRVHNNRRRNWLIWRDQAPRARRGSHCVGNAAVPLGPSQQRLLRFRVSRLAEVNLRIKRNRRTMPEHTATVVLPPE